ncbi:transcription termination factor NusA [bacterium]|nr:transcription termination factor NusA [bacterium]
MANDFMSIIEFLEKDRGVDKEVLIQAIETAILQASRKSKKLDLADDADVRVHIDRVTGNIDVFLGDKKITPTDFGRIAAQTAKQVIMQKMKEAETGVLFQEYKQKQKELVNGTILRFEGSNIIMEIGKVEAVLPKKEQVTNDGYKMHDRFRAYVLDVTKTHSNLKMIVSRTHPNFVKKLFEFEVPEIYEGVVEIKAIAREAGDRTKIAVHTESATIDCVGACVGIRGSRVRNIVNELRGEKIDIVRWDQDQVNFIKNSLAPAEINRINLNEKEKTCDVIVAEDQLSLAIGKKGQNARLAAKLTGWNINISTGKSDASQVSSLFKPEVEVGEDIEAMKQKAIEELTSISGVGEKAAILLIEAGFTSLAQLKDADAADLVEIEGIGEKMANKIIESAKSGGGDA